MDLFKNACRIHLDFAINRYLMANADGRADGAEKALRHREICSFYLAAFKGEDVEWVAARFTKDYVGLHDYTQQLTDFLDEQIGFPIKGMPDYDLLVPLFFEKFHALAMGFLTKQSAPPGA